jgi:hypothetical protein
VVVALELLQVALLAVMVELTAVEVVLQELH